MGSITDLFNSAYSVNDYHRHYNTLSVYSVNEYHRHYNTLPL